MDVTVPGSRGVEGTGSSGRARPSAASKRAALVLLMGLFLVHARFLACVAEDSHITFRFARNLADGHGFVWNVGEPPIEGFTTFLWVLVCALASGAAEPGRFRCR
jgi:hypothetical protein